jgi:hypothetical protein
MRALFLSSMMAAAGVLAVDHAWALGHGLGQTKEQLKLDYEVSAVVHITGRVTVSVTIADQGRLTPLESVDLVIPSQDGSGYVDLSVSLATREVDGTLHVRAHLIRELADRAEIHLRTWTLDGEQQAETWYYHAIPIAEFIGDREQKRQHPQGSGGQGVQDHRGEPRPRAETLLPVETLAPESMGRSRQPVSDRGRLARLHWR